MVEVSQDIKSENYQKEISFNTIYYSSNINSIYILLIIKLSEAKLVLIQSIIILIQNQNDIVNL